MFTKLKTNRRLQLIVGGVVAIVVIIIAVIVIINVQAGAEADRVAAESAEPPIFPEGSSDGIPKYDANGVLEGGQYQILQDLDAVNKQTGLSLKVPEAWTLLKPINLSLLHTAATECDNSYAPTDPGGLTSPDDENSTYGCTPTPGTSDLVDINLIVVGSPEDEASITASLRAQRTTEPNISGVFLSTITAQSTLEIGGVTVTLQEDSSTPISVATWQKDGVSYALTTPASLASAQQFVTELFGVLFA